MKQEVRDMNAATDTRRVHKAEGICAELYYGRLYPEAGDDEQT